MPRPAGGARRRGQGPWGLPASPSTTPALGDATLRSAAASSSKGCGPGTSSAIDQRSEPGTAPWRRRGRRPALSRLDFPEPEGPTTARKRPPAGSASRSSSLSIRASRPKNSSASASSNGRSPLYGLRAAATSAPATAGSRARALARAASTSCPAARVATLRRLRERPGDRRRRGARGARAYVRSASAAPPRGAPTGAPSASCRRKGTSPVRHW